MTHTETTRRLELREKLSNAINCTENASNTPDFILAEYLVSCLDAFAGASNAREKWYGKSLSIGGEPDTPTPAQQPAPDVRAAAGRVLAARERAFQYQNTPPFYIQRYQDICVELAPDLARAVLAAPGAGAVDGYRHVIDQWLICDNQEGATGDANADFTRLHKAMYQQCLDPQICEDAAKLRDTYKPTPPPADVQALVEEARKCGGFVYVETKRSTQDNDQLISTGKIKDGGLFVRFADALLAQGALAAELKIDRKDALDDASYARAHVVKRDETILRLTRELAEAKRERDNLALQVRAHKESGTCPNQPLIDDLERWRKEANQAVSSERGKTGALRKAQAELTAARESISFITNQRDALRTSLDESRVLHEQNCAERDAARALADGLREEVASARKHLKEVMDAEAAQWRAKKDLEAERDTLRAERDALYGEAREPKNLHRYTAVELFLKNEHCKGLEFINALRAERDEWKLDSEQRQKHCMEVEEERDEALKRAETAYVVIGKVMGATTGWRPPKGEDVPAVVSEVVERLDALQADLTTLRAAVATALDLPADASVDACVEALQRVGPVEWQGESCGDWITISETEARRLQAIPVAAKTRAIRVIAPAGGEETK